MYAVLAGAAAVGVAAAGVSRSRGNANQIVVAASVLATLSAAAALYSYRQCRKAQPERKQPAVAAGKVRTRTQCATSLLLMPRL